MIRRTTVFLVCALCLLGNARFSRAEILAYGSRDSYWLAQVHRDPSGEVRSLVQFRPIGSAGPWKTIARINSPLRSITRLGTNLAVLLEDGQWMRVWDGGSSLGTVPEDGSKLVQIAGSDETLWAIATAGSGRTPTTAGATQPAATMPKDTRLLYRLDNGRWKLVGMLPNSAQDARSLSLRRVGDSMMLAALGSAGRADVFRLDSLDLTWQSAGSVELPPEAERIKLLANLDRPTLWAIWPGSAGVVTWFEGQWSTPVELKVAADTLGDGADEATVAGRSIRLLIETGEKIGECSFDRSGQPQGTAVNVPVPTFVTEPADYEWLTAVAAAALLIVIMNTMRRKEPVTPETLATTGLELAPFGRRLIAGLIDAAPVIGTLVIVVSQANHQDPENVDAAINAARYPFYVAMGVYILHTTVCELRWGWSIGKRLLGMRVAMIDGAPPVVRAIILRNLLRVLDVMIFFAPLLIILVSPLRQRIGDIVGETIVVKDKPKDPGPSAGGGGA